jgi:hypothetical protein
MTRSLHEVRRAIAASWGPETAHATAEYMAAGREHDRSRGQCGTSALVLHDWLGGELLVADVLVGGDVKGVHYWNRLPGGEEIDLTADQFVPGETLGEAREAARPAELPVHGREAYLLLRDRVAALLG